MSSSELRPISVPLKEQELFDSEARVLTPEGSIFQRWLLFTHIVNNEELSEGLRSGYQQTADQDARRLGIQEQNHPELPLQWESIRAEREERMRDLPRASVIFEASARA